MIEADIAKINRESVAVANGMADDADDIPFDNLVGETDPRKQMEALGFSDGEINEILEAEGRKTDEVAARTAQESNQPGDETQTTEKALGEHKARREREGLHGGRGAIPPNAIIGKQGGQDQQNNDPTQKEIARPELNLAGQTPAARSRRAKTRNRQGRMLRQIRLIYLIRRGIVQSARKRIHQQER